MAMVRVLPSLPTYGPLPEQFSATGRGTHREGFVVEFLPEDAPVWVGNFQRGLTSLDEVLVEPGTKWVIVIAGGEAYVVEPRSRTCVETFGGQIEEVWKIPPGTLVFSNGLWFEALGPDGLSWRTRQVSWDGFRNVRVDGGVIRGEAWNPMDDWAPFTVDVATGEVRGGSFPPEIPH